MLPSFAVFTIADRYDSNGILMTYPAKAASLSPIRFWIRLFHYNADCLGISLVV